MTNTTNYFENCKTAEDVKRVYRKYAMKLHPDNTETGNADAFKELSNQYTKAFDRLKGVHENADGETYTKETDETPEQFKDIIDKIIFFEGCTIEIIGAWVWVSGNTFTYKDELKKAGFKFSGKKIAWFWHFGEYHKHTKRNYTLQELRERYETQEIETEYREKLA